MNPFNIRIVLPEEMRQAIRQQIFLEGAQWMAIVFLALIAAALWWRSK